MVMMMVVVVFILLHLQLVPPTWRWGDDDNTYCSNKFRQYTALLSVTANHITLHSPAVAYTHTPAVRAPQANFHFLLHHPSWSKGDASLSSPVLQEAFFDPDVLVDWDTVETVRLFRKVAEKREAVSPGAAGVAVSSDGGNSGEANGTVRDGFQACVCRLRFFGTGGEWLETTPSARNVVGWIRVKTLNKT